MQIPFDRYRILGIPYQAPTEQIQQAYCDRQQQPPASGYSAVALASREALLAETHAELSDLERRAAYDKTLLPAASSGASAPLPSRRQPALPPTQLEAVLARACRRRQGPVLTVPPEQFMGALLVLLEAGEYPLVQEIARACFQDEEVLAQLPRADLALAATQAFRERGRELWQQQQYQQANAQLEMARHLAETESIPTAVRQDVLANLARLRPYEILTLLSVPKRTEALTERALALLQTMLDARGGMDGADNGDRSGLSGEQFFRFVQQLRPYLDAEEQFRLFDREAKRSGTAACLLAYTQIARGFAGFNPPLLLQAASVLERIGRRRPHQDVWIEKAICALLLGRTEAATVALQQSRDRQALDLIHKTSEGAPDLLPGLCKYAEQWLHTQVLPEFRDLSQRRVTLTEYFADRQVQTALDRMAEAPAIRPRAVVTPAPVEAEAMPMAAGQAYPVFYPDDRARSPRLRERGGDRAVAGTAAVMTAAPAGAGGAAVTAAALSQSQGQSFSSVPGTTLGGGGAGRSDDRSHQADFVRFDPNRRARRRAMSAWRAPGERLASVSPSRQTAMGWALAFVGAAGAAIALTGVWSGRETPQKDATLPGLAGEQLLVRLDGPPSVLADALLAATAPVTAEPAVPATTQNTPAAAIAGWLDAKVRAYGPEHDLEALAEVLAGAPLAQHQQWAAELKRQGGYRTFAHAIDADTVRVLSQTGDRAVVEATVRETATDRASNGGNPAGIVLYDANLRVRYELGSSDGSTWKIDAIQVVKKLS